MNIIEKYRSLILKGLAEITERAERKYGKDDERYFGEKGVLGDYNVISTALFKQIMKILEEDGEVKSIRVYREGGSRVNQVNFYRLKEKSEKK